MNLKKKELIITIIMIIGLVVSCFNLNVYASNNGFKNVTLTSDSGNTIKTNIIEVVDNTTTNTTVNTTTNTTTNTTSNTTSGQLADTGLEDLPWLVIAACIVSAVFAYKKIREYNSI